MRETTNTETTMTTTIKDAMDKAMMSEVMVAERITDFGNSEAISAVQAIAKADKTCNAVHAAYATRAANIWIDAHPNQAMAIINKRIADRAALDAAPVSDAVARALRCED
jgi:hypothetical protein